MDASRSCESDPATRGVCRPCAIRLVRISVGAVMRRLGKVGFKIQAGFVAVAALVSLSGTAPVRAAPATPGSAGAAAGAASARAATNVRPVKVGAPPNRDGVADHSYVPAAVHWPAAATTR